MSVEEITTTTSQPVESNATPTALPTPAAPAAPAAVVDAPATTDTPAAVDVPATPATADAPAPAPAPAAAAPPAARRRGRGTFNQAMRAEHLSTSNGAAAADGGSVFTAVTTAVIPVTTPSSALPRCGRPPEEDLAAEYAGQKKDIPLNIRENFGVCENGQEADTVRQLLFRGEKRRRYCIIVGELQNPLRPITLKLFGHKGLKPFKLQNKLIRLVNISVGRPRLPRPVDPNKEDSEEHNNSDAGSDDGEDNDVGVRHTITKEETAENCETTNLTGEGTTDEKSEREVITATCEVAEEGEKEKEAPQYEGSTNEGDTPIGVDVNKKVCEASNSVSTANAVEQQGSSGEIPEKAQQLTVQHEDVDGYAEQDEVVPLTVETRESTTDMGQPSSVANSPVLTAKRFETLEPYFFNELRFLLGMEDIGMQHVSICLNLGAAYCCLAREGSYSTPLRYATFGEFVQRMNEESMQMYFLKDAPICVSRAVDKECGALQSESTFSLVKICFFSNERQSRSVARAMWDAHENRFVLVDMENSGVTFTWTVFSVDETGVQVAPLPSAVDPTAAPSEESDATKHAQMGRKKTAAFPFEVELHAYRRWKHHTEHPAASIAEAIIDKLSLAEHNLIHYGSTIGYEHMDLSHVCEVDAESDDFNIESIIVEHTSRVKPRGTGLTVDSTSSLWIENFAAARALKNRLAQGAVESVELHQSASRGRLRRGHGRGRAPPLPVIKAPAASPASRLTFFRSRGSTVHWKLRPGRGVEENLAPLTEALRFTQQVLNTANEIERTSVRGGAAPDAL